MAAIEARGIPLAVTEKWVLMAGLMGWKGHLKEFSHKMVQSIFTGDIAAIDALVRQYNTVAAVAATSVTGSAAAS